MSRTRAWLWTSLCVIGIALVGGCSTGSEPSTQTERSDGAGADADGSVPGDGASQVSELCQAGADRIVERFREFASGFDGMSPQEFLAAEEIDGLAPFQNDVAQMITETTNQNSTLCDLNGLQQFIDAELAAIESPDVITSYLISTVRFGGNLERADVAVRPGDDVVAILALLDDGSTISFSEGTHQIEAPLLVGRDITLIGAGREETTIVSSAPDAAVAVFGNGRLTVRDVTIEHTGASPASVILAFGAPIEMRDTTIAGARGDAEAGGTGNGILLSGGVPPDGDERPVDVADSVLTDVEIIGNEVAGIAINDGLEPAIVGAIVSGNDLCGICFLGDSGGLLESSTIESNAFGVQTGDRSAPIIRNNLIRSNQVVGVVAIGESTPLVEGNTVENNLEGGIAVQENARPQLIDNVLGVQPFAMTLVGSSAAEVLGNSITGADVGIQIADDARPIIRSNALGEIAVAGFVNRDTSSAEIDDNSVIDGASVAVLVEGDSTPTITALVVVGTEVGVSYRESGGGSLSESSFDLVAIGVQIEDDAVPRVSANEFSRPSAAAIVVRSTGTAEIVDNTVVDPETLGIGVAADSAALVETNRITGGETALSAIEDSVPTVSNNTFIGQLVAVQVADRSQPRIEQNEIVNPSGVGVVYRDTSGGVLEQNTIVDAGAVGIQLIDDAAPEIIENVVVAGILDQDALADGGDADEENGAGTDADGEADEEGDADADGEADEENGAGTEGDADPDEEDASESGSADDGPVITVAILASGSTGGTVRANELLGFIVGVQVEEDAAPTLIENLIDGGASQGVGVLYRDRATGRAEANRTRLHTIGFQVDDQAAPRLVDNVIEWVSEVAILIQGDSTPAVLGNRCPAGVPGLGVRAPAMPEVGENECDLVSADS